MIPIWGNIINLDFWAGQKKLTPHNPGSSYMVTAAWRGASKRTW